LLHEERFSWLDKSGQPAAVATLSALERTIASPDEASRETYTLIHAWWSRHALRAADSSAAYPDVYFRRVADDIEISWLSRQPDFAPEGFSLTLAPGYALLPVSAVAEPLWQFMEWALNSAPVVNETDQRIATQLLERFYVLRQTPVSRLEQAYIGEKLQRLLESTREVVALTSDQESANAFPAIVSLDSAVLMFGGLNVELGEADIRHLLGFLAAQQGKPESGPLSQLVRNPESDAWSRPFEEGYQLAEDCRDDLYIASDRLFVDVEGILLELGVAVIDEALETNAIRGVAVAGRTHGPAILVNKASYYNNNAAGRRFTLAHEFCHILYDRTRARKLSHLSGPWASARTEKRANAFAAMFLAPPSAIRSRLSEIASDAIHGLANDLGMGFSALVEHLCNIDLINEVEREKLRQER
jgi:Zn-dependent peptidase ImmA (M78 family)